MVCYIINSIESSIDPKFVEFELFDLILFVVVFLYFDIHPFYILCCSGIANFMDVGTSCLTRPYPWW